MFSGWHIGRSQKKNFLCEVYDASKESGIDRGWTKATLSFLQGKKNNCIGRGNTKMLWTMWCLVSVYDRYSIGIVIGQYIGFADMGNVLTVSLLVLADKDFHIGR